MVKECSRLRMPLFNPSIHLYVSLIRNTYVAHSTHLSSQSLLSHHPSAGGGIGLIEFNCLQPNDSDGQTTMHRRLIISFCAKNNSECANL